MIDKKKITQWLKWAESVTLQGNEDSGLAAFPQFAMVWMAFNAVYNESYRNENLSEKNKIKKFCEKSAIKYIHQQLINKNDEYAKAISILEKELDDIGLINLTGRERSPICEREYPLRLNGPKTFKRLIDIIYTIRCNLFHGDKLIARDRDAKLCEYSHKILSNFLKVYSETQREN